MITINIYDWPEYVPLLDQETVYFIGNSPSEVIIDVVPSHYTHVSLLNPLTLAIPSFVSLTSHDSYFLIEVYTESLVDVGTHVLTFAALNETA